MKVLRRERASIAETRASIKNDAQRPGLCEGWEMELLSLAWP